MNADPVVCPGRYRGICPGAVLITRIAAKSDPLAITAASTHEPFAVAGPQNAIPGERRCAFEALLKPGRIDSSNPGRKRGR